MKYECELIQDLLPLYQDNVCSETSRTIVKEHLKECSDCQTLAEKLQNSEVDKRLIEEKSNILSAHERKERRKTYTVGMITAGILLIPILVCLICNLAVEHSLDWFFIVLASLLVFASLTVLPLLLPEKRLFWTILGFTASLLILLLVCCLYVGDDWFFVAATPCVLAISVIFAPYIVKQLPLGEKLGRHKGMLVMLWDTVWVYLLIVVCGIFVDGNDTYWRISLSAAFCGLLLPWVIFVIVRYFRTNRYIKAGLCVAIDGVLTALLNDMVRLMSGEAGEAMEQSIRYMDFSAGIRNPDYRILNANIYVIIMVLSLFAGCALCVAGIVKNKKMKGFL